jgi:hypothetical protein
MKVYILLIQGIGDDEDTFEVSGVFGSREKAEAGWDKFKLDESEANDGEDVWSEDFWNAPYEIQEFDVQ